MATRKAKGRTSQYGTAGTGKGKGAMPKPAQIKSTPAKRTASNRKD